MMAQFSTFSATALRMSSGVLIWGGHFLVIYSATAIACARALGHIRWLGIGLVPWIIGVATLTGVGAICWIIAHALGRTLRSSEADRTGHFVDWMTAAVCALALIAMLWEALPVLLVPLCR